MIFWVTVIVAYIIFIGIYTSKKEDGHYRLFDEKVIEKNKKISYMRSWVLNFMWWLWLKKFHLTK